MGEKISRELVYEKLFDSYNYGNLGLFIGAGFSKAVTKNKALNWFELIEQASKELDIEFLDDKQLIGVSLPEVSTKLCKRLSKMKSISYEDAKMEFKDKICEITNWFPDQKEDISFKEKLNQLSPAWVITTNYDLILETILSGKSKSLSSNDYLSAPKNIIPIYHIHGIRKDPKSIIITQDDYIPIFRPNEYRQTKLAMSIRESTTLVLGYNLGDMNVLSALDWSKNIYTNENEYPHEIIQAFWTDSPKEECYRDENGNIIIEINDIEQFLDELISYMLDKKQEYDEELEELKELLNEDKFKSENRFRIDLLKELPKFQYHMLDLYIDFLSKCIDDIWNEARKDGNFYEYDKCLNTLLNIIINYRCEKVPPQLFRIICNYLNKVFGYVNLTENNRSVGLSWYATKSWHKRKGDIPSEMKKELLRYAIENNLNNIKKALGNVNNNIDDASQEAAVTLNNI